MAEKNRILIYGYGNPGCQDDGLGKALADRAEAWIGDRKLRSVDVDVAFQLQIEDVLKLTDRDLVLFVDASMEERITDFSIDRVMPDPEASFRPHSVPPSFIVGLYEVLYGTPPPAYLIQIRGYEWELEEPMTPRARRNMEKAWGLIKRIVMDPDILTDQPRSAESGMADRECDDGRQ